jgi:hypothetical protein
VDTGPDLSPSSDLRRFAQEVGVWEADLVPVAARIAGKERQRTVAALVAAEDQVLLNDGLVDLRAPIAGGLRGSH